MVCKTKHHFNESNIINIEMNIFCRNNLKLLQFHWLKGFMHRYPTHQWWDWPRFFLTRHGMVWFGVLQLYFVTKVILFCTRLWGLTRQALLHALLRFWACWKLNETLVLSNDNFHQSHSWWWQGLWKYDVWWYYWSHDHGFVRQGVAVPEAAVTLQQAIPEEEQTVTIKLQGLKRKRVTVTITDDKAEFIWKGLNLKRYRIWKAYKVFSPTSFHQILKLKNVASGKWK